MQTATSPFLKRKQTHMYTQLLRAFEKQQGKEEDRVEDNSRTGVAKAEYGWV